MRDKIKPFLSLVLVVVLLFSAAGCASTETVISNTLPYEAQQRIKTSKEFSVDLTFEPHPDAKTITATFAGAGNSKYSVNEPFRGKLKQLFRAKFGEISEESENKVRVEISDISTKTEITPAKHRLSMTVNVNVSHNGKNNSRKFSFQTTVRPEKRGLSYRIPPKPIEDFLMQYIVGIDSFLDSSLGIES